MRSDVECGYLLGQSISQVSGKPLSLIVCFLNPLSLIRFVPSFRGCYFVVQFAISSAALILLLYSYRTQQDLRQIVDEAPHKQIMIIDTNIALHQIDALDHKCPATCLVVVLQTVLQVCVCTYEPFQVVPTEYKLRDLAARFNSIWVV